MVSGVDVLGGLIIAARCYVAAKTAWQKAKAKRMAMNDTFDYDALNDELTVDEGRKLALYVDTRGYASIGTGRNLTSNGIRPDELELMLRNDIAEAVAALDHHASWWRELPKQQQRVLINLTFNLGWFRLSQFVKFLAAMHDRRWHDAADELRNSLWWHQVGSRGPRMVMRILNGAG